MSTKDISNPTPSSSDRHPQSENYTKMVTIICITTVTLVVLIPFIGKIIKYSTPVELIDYLKNIWSYLGCSAITVVLDRQLFRKSNDENHN